MTKQDLKMQVANIADSIMLQASEYAKQQAIAFSEWCGANYIRGYDPVGEVWLDSDGREYKSDELYNKFIEQQNKQV